MGLLPTPMQQGQAPQPDAQPMEAPQEEQSNVSPEEQAEYDTFVQKAGEIIYGEGEVMPEILESLAPAREPAQDPAAGNTAVQALANTAVQVVQKLDVASKEAGAQVSDDVLYHGGAEVVEMLAEVAEEGGIYTFTEEEIQGAFFQAVDSYRSIAQAMGRTDEETLKQQFGEVVAADEQGKLGELLPGAEALTAGPTQ